MIQRIQTLWLLIAMAAGVSLLYLPVWQAAAEDTLRGMESIGAANHLYLLPFPPLLFLTHAVSIFTYKRRVLQLRWCNISILFFILFLITTLIVLQVENQLLQNFKPEGFQWGLILPFIGIAFDIMAKRGVKKDEALIRSMDRLR